MSTSTASRPLSSRATTHEPNDYPIILGDSLKSEASSHSQYLRLRYNWEPRQGFSNQKGTLKRVHGQTRLAYEDDKSGSSTYDYSASASINVNDDDSDNQISQFALIFDAQKSAYVLERISQSFDLNLASAHDQSRDEIRQHKQITNSSSEDTSEQRNGAGGSSSKDEDEADSANPFDFRHFLSEAKENAEKGAQPTGNRTPVPGSRTPLSGISSPSLGAGRFLSSSTSQFRPTPTSVPLPKKPTVPKTATPATSKKPIANKRKPAAPKATAAKSQPQPQLSREIVSDSSDDDSQDTITVSKREASPPRERGHARNASSISQGRSPHIVVDNGGLVIDMGSPPPETRRGPLIDRDAFRRSQTHTPIAGVSSNRQPPPRSQADFEMRDRSDEDEDEDEDKPMVDVDVDMDEDVDELVLDSPRSKKGDERGEEMEKAPSPPTPLPPHPVDEYDDDDLAAELAAALGDDDDDNDEPSMHVVDDESEVSEEE